MVNRKHENLLAETALFQPATGGGYRMSRRSAFKQLWAAGVTKYRHYTELFWTHKN